MAAGVVTFLKNLFPGLSFGSGDSQRQAQEQAEEVGEDARGPVLLVGSTGRTGRWIAERLMEKGRAVVALVSNEEKATQVRGVQGKRERGARSGKGLGRDERTERKRNKNVLDEDVQRLINLCNMQQGHPSLVTQGKQWGHGPSLSALLLWLRPRPRDIPSNATSPCAAESCTLCTVWHTATCLVAV